MTYTLVGFPKEDKQPMKAAFDMMAKASQRACQALLKGDLSAYNVFFEATGTQHLMKVASVVKGIDDTIRNKKVTFVYAGARAHRRQQHVCGNRVKVLPKGVLAEVTGKDTQFTGRDFGSKVVNTPDGQIKVEQGWELKWLAAEGLTVYVVPKAHSGDTKYLAETLYHELSHAVANTDDLTYDEPSCKKLAQEGGASINAENYCLFASHYMGA